MQFTAKRLRTQIQAIARAAERMNRNDHQVWHSRLQLVYGDMQGQRGVDFSSFAGSLDRHCVIIALESLYYLLTVLLSTSAFYKDPAVHLCNASRRKDAAFDRFLSDVIGGREYENLGIAGCTDVYPLDWLTDADQDLRATLRQLIGSLAECWDPTTSVLRLPGDDPFQAIHRQLFPSNLMHITGQFYSPEWLAELLIDDVSWQPDQTLIDPFCGSGVFLTKALRVAVRDGHCPDDVLQNVVGIDINPFAAAATRANLALFIARSQFPRTERVHLNVICADAIWPSIRSGKLLAGDDSSATAIGGGTTPSVDLENPVHVDAVFEAATLHGFNLQRWRPKYQHSNKAETSKLPSQQRSVIEQLLTCCLQKADVVATNPPWVGWEYLSRPYRESIRCAWTAHDLFQSKGLEAAFLKEDLSNLALLAAWDAYLCDQGRSVVVLRPSTMRSDVASRGVRRLSLRDGGIDLQLQRIRTFDGIRLFKTASTGAATWMIRKGQKTEFPVPVSEFQKIEPGWNPSPTDSASDVVKNTRLVEKVAEPTEPADAMSRWMITTTDKLASMRRLRGSNQYTPRMGVFTGGANAVFYLQRSSDAAKPSYVNITARSKRKVSQVEVDVEQRLVHSIARGRDIGMWQCRPDVFLLLPHTETSQMYPIAERDLEVEYPNAYRYLCTMKNALQARNGFANWEKRIHLQHFYTLQRVGAYTFAPYKVCWRYIASEFTICVLESDRDGKVIVPNDKVMFIPVDDPLEAYYVAGFLSSELIRQYVNCVIEKRQISTRVIKSLAIPSYDPNRESHRIIADLCRRGHRALQQQPEVDVSGYKEKINDLVEKMFP